MLVLDCRFAARDLPEKFVGTKLKFGIGVTVILASLASLAWVGVRDSKTYYHTISELSALQPKELHERMRVSGNVDAGSIQRRTGVVQFVLVEEGHKLTVSYVGADPLPDNFQDGSEALCEGKLASDGQFQAESIQSKCASKYEAAPTAGKS
jgi:cytochrome c-type biogenesis protein CcmE